MFEIFIRNVRTEKYNLMCSVTAHDSQQPTYVDDASISGGRSMHNNETTKALKSLGVTLNFIDCWFKHFQHNYQVILIIYHEAMIELFKQIPTMKSRPLSQYKKHQFLLTDVGSSWYMKKLVRSYHHFKNRI